MPETERQQSLSAEPIGKAPAFSIQIPGKWVLTGEHAVLRGAQAVALPHPTLGLFLQFHPSSASEPYRSALADHPLLQELLEGHLRPEQVPSGALTLKSSLPIQAGLGSSAALCVALTRWLKGPLQLQTEDDCLRFATALEDRFHGKSSGMDVATIAAGEPISFHRGGPIRKLGIRKLPKFTFHDTGLRSSTRDCVEQVFEFHRDRSNWAQAIDARMEAASQLATKGLELYQQQRPEPRPLSAESGLQALQEAMDLAHQCFLDWNLVPAEITEQRQNLLQQGALACKLTGAGRGGMWVALWPDSGKDSTLR
jgi:mevalonate kinase